jgi:hypothetical protein
MIWQWLAVAVCVVMAGGYVARQTWRTWAGRGTGCGACSCAGKTPSAAENAPIRLISTSELTARLRRR